MEVNPFAVSATQPLERGVFADHVTLKQRNFLYRVLEVRHPFAGELIYDGWWFRQTVLVNGIPQWFAISWLTIRPQFEFELSPEIAIDPQWCVANSAAVSRTMRFEIQFSRGLQIRRFRIWLADRMLYDEIA